MGVGPSDYALLELLNRLGGVQGRKKLQKLAYIAKLDGLPLEDEFVFHYYGPYSSGLASRVDQLVGARLLKETSRRLAVPDGVAYGYKLTARARSLLKRLEPKVPGEFRKTMDRAIDRAAPLKDREVFELELASSLLYWLDKGHTWSEAEEITSQRKQAEPADPAFRHARRIAQDAWEARAQQGN